MNKIVNVNANFFKSIEIIMESLLENNPYQISPFSDKFNIEVHENGCLSLEFPGKNVMYTFDGVKVGVSSKAETLSAEVMADPSILTDCKDLLTDEAKRIAKKSALARVLIFIQEERNRLNKLKSIHFHKTSILMDLNTSYGVLSDLTDKVNKLMEEVENENN